MDQGYTIILNLRKGNSANRRSRSRASILTVFKNALFTRKKHIALHRYCDEIQNLIAYRSGIETILSEARKFGVGIVSANQFLDQFRRRCAPRSFLSARTCSSSFRAQTPRGRANARRGKVPRRTAEESSPAPLRREDRLGSLARTAGAVGSTSLA